MDLMEPPVWGADAGPVAEDPRRRWAGRAIGVAVVLGLVWFFAGGGPDPDVLIIGDRGTSTPTIVDDGVPVHLLRTHEGSIQAFEAVVPGFGAETGIGELVAWCEQNQTFVAGHLGRTWSEGGVPLVGGSPGRLARDSTLEPGPLVVRGVSRLPLQGDRTLPIRIGSPMGPVEADGKLRPELTPGRGSFGPPLGCRIEPRPPLGPPLTPIDVDVQEAVDHSRFAAPLPDNPDDGWMLAEGALYLAADGSGVWCPRDVGDQPCAGGDEIAPSPVPVRLPLTVEHTGGAPAVLVGEMAVQVEEGRITGVRVMRSTDWRGSSLQGATSYRATDAEVSVDASLIRVLPIDDPQPQCTGATQSLPGDRLTPDELRQVMQYVDIDTLMDIQAVEDASEVEVIVDRATCRALIVRPVA